MAESTAKRCCQSFILEFHYSKLWFFYPDSKAFAYSPWLPYKYPYQAIYLVYRWLLVVYFLAWIVAGGIQAGGPDYFIFLTNWAFITYNAYLIVAALSTTAKYSSLLWYKDERSDDEQQQRRIILDPKKPAGCCGYIDNRITWYQIIHWFMFVIGNELAFIILVLYWALLFRGQSVDGVNINTHLLNGIFSIVDLWVSGVPVNFLHFIYLMIYGAIYAVFSGIYFVPSGDIIYPVLDYGTNIGLAVGLCFGVVFVVLPLVHIVAFYLQSLAKYWLLYCLFAKKQVPADVERDTDPMAKE